MNLLTASDRVPSAVTAMIGALTLAPVTAALARTATPVVGGGCWPATGSAAMCGPFSELLKWFLPSLSAGS
ncbi:hypothetical protein APR12_004366 [Nocardia amikacinitolerans]|uniref:hypothetical protein n=1 Tax=Nocardia amikacinitolerans TaxID=756689 RepID=UPI000830ADD7|nr:hypothetical protein [Nocardia amikacinitolerans]MCP2319003.1 hypothetical protein [Nocardia amikacinitolerans]